MSAHAYTEDQLVEQPAIGLFAELGWTTASEFQNLSQTRDRRLLFGHVIQSLLAHKNDCSRFYLCSRKREQSHRSGSR